MLLVVARLPGAPDVHAAAAQVTGLDVSEIRMRLAGGLPRVLLTAADGERVSALAQALQKKGFGAFACDPVAVPTQDARIVARTAEFDDRTLIAIDEQGQRHTCESTTIGLLIRGTRISKTEKSVKTSTRQLSLGRAVLSGGLLFTKKVDHTTTHTTEQREDLFVLHRNDGEPDIVFTERGLDYRFLGKDVQPSSRANFDTLLARVRHLAPAARFDDRILRPGFMAGLPASAVDKLDLALFLVTVTLTAFA